MIYVLVVVIIIIIIIIVIIMIIDCRFRACELQSDLTGSA